MILYFDSSALVKAYVAERETAAVQRILADTDVAGTSAITRAEVVAALAKAVRIGVLSANGADTARDRFQRDWPDLVRIPVGEIVVERAGDIAWQHGLRAYDAVQLASATVWAEALNDEILFATYDRRLADAASARGFEIFP